MSTIKKRKTHYTPKDSVDGGKAEGQSILSGGLSPAAVKGMQQTVHRTRKGAPRPKQAAGNGEAGLKQEASHRGAVKVIPKPKLKRLFEDIEVQVYNKRGAMTVEQAMELIGWTVVEEGPFHLRDGTGAKVFLKNNSTNRPFRLGLANRYKSEYLRNKWKLNGETLVFDWFGQAQSCQHRLAGFILAEQMRHLDKDKWKEKCQLYWKRGGPLTFECIVVKGIDPSPEVVDTLDLGQKRTMGDVFYREERFAGPAPFVGKEYDANGKAKGSRLPAPPMSEVVRRKLCNILANATRLIWLRAGGKSVADAPHFPHSEALDFIDANPRIEESVLYVWGLEGGSGKGGCNLSRFISLGYAAGLHYLMMVSGTDPEEFKDSREAALDFKMEKKAAEFWAKMASGAKLEQSDPILVVRQMLMQVDAGSGTGRDEIVGMIIKAFNIWVDGKKADPKDIAMKKSENDLGKMKLAEEPRLGGMDVAGPEKPEHLDTDKMEDTREGSMTDGKNWAEGDTCWVRQDDGDHWFGTIVELIKTVEGKVAMVEDADTGRRWEEQLKNLWLKYPG